MILELGGLELIPSTRKLRSISIATSVVGGGTDDHDIPMQLRGDPGCWTFVHHSNFLCPFITEFGWFESSGLLPSLCFWVWDNRISVYIYIYVRAYNFFFYLRFIWINTYPTMKIDDKKFTRLSNIEYLLFQTNPEHKILTRKLLYTHYLFTLFIRDLPAIYNICRLYVDATIWWGLVSFKHLLMIARTRLDPTTM